MVMAQAPKKDKRSRQFSPLGGQARCGQILGRQREGVRPLEQNENCAGIAGRRGRVFSSKVSRSRLAQEMLFPLSIETLCQAPSLSGAALEQISENAGV